MPDHGELKARIDALPDAALPAVDRLLSTIVSMPAVSASPGFTYLLPAEELLWSRSETACAEGNYVTHEALLGQRAARRGLP
jgi:hypothetical protein